MNVPRRRAWLGAVLVCGFLYLVIGRVPVPAVLEWRLAAWIVSGLVYATHIWYEHSRMRNRPVIAASHVALAVAIGGFTLAIAAMIHALRTRGTIAPFWLVALVAWPAITAIPGFAGALIAATILSRFAPRRAC
jgi:hypothetical protein